MSIDTGPRRTSTATASPLECVIEMPLSFSLGVGDAHEAGRTDIADELHAAAVEGYRAAADELDTAARSSVPCILRAHDPLRRCELGAVTVHTTIHEYGVEAFPYLHAHLVVDPRPRTGSTDDVVYTSALVDTVPAAQTRAVRTAAEQLQRVGYSMSQLPQSPYGWELSAIADDALTLVDQSDGGRAFTCPRVQARSRQLFPVDVADPATRADREAGRLFGQ